jgi:hypothetical protein
VTKKIFKMSERTRGRNGAIWKAHVIGGVCAAELAEAFNMTEANVYRIFEQCRREFPPEEQDEIRKVRREVIDWVKGLAAEMALLDPSPSFAPNGKAQIDPATGRPVYDYSLRLNAIDRILKADERLGKLTGTDSPVTHTVQVSAEAQQATKDQADKAEQMFSHLMAPAGVKLN